MCLPCTPPGLPAPPRAPLPRALGPPRSPGCAAARLRRRPALTGPERRRRRCPIPLRRRGRRLRRAAEQRAGQDTAAAAVLAAPPATAVAHGVRKAEEWGAGWATGKWGPAVSPPFHVFHFYYSADSSKLGKNS